MIFRDSRTNYIINGAMTFHQRFVSTAFNYSGTGTVNGCVADRWRLSVSGTTSKNFLIVRSTDVPTYAQSGEQYTYSSSLTINTGTSLGTSDYLAPFQYIMEGYDANQIRGKDVSVSFWFKSSVTGTYTLAIHNGATVSGFRAYSTTFTVNTANTWELKTFNLSIENYTPGTNGTTTGQGFILSIAPISGRTDTTASSLNTWLDVTTGLPSVAAANTNYGGTTGAVVRLTGVQMVLGSDTPASYSYYGGTIAGELAACQRYYEKSYGAEIVPGTNSTNGLFDWFFPVASTSQINMYSSFKSNKRTSPTTSIYDSVGNLNRVTRGGTTNTTATVFGVGEFGFNAVSTGTNNAQEIAYHFTADAEF